MFSGKSEELIRVTGQLDIKIPIVANVFVPSLPVARSMARGLVPGIVFPPELLRIMETEAKQGDSESRLERAARLLYTLRSQGYAGVHLGGSGLDFAAVRHIMDRAEALEEKGQHLTGTNDYRVATVWYFYKNDDDRQANLLHPGRHRGAYRLQHLIHNLLFRTTNTSSRLFGRFCLLFDKSTTGRRFFTWLEQSIKRLLFSCRMCGDCTLPSSTYLCPQSGCPKNLLNGPCGGSREERCEVYPDRRCFWCNVYDRLDPADRLEDLGSLEYMVPKEWQLDQSSSWLNFFRAQLGKRYNKK
jgi:methylenetetrahydrofolate reductase (NADPH)